MKHLIVLLAFAVAVFATSCSNSDSPSSNPSPNSMTATVTGNQNIQFTAQAVNFSNFPTGTIRLSGTYIKSATESYTINFVVPDTVTGKLNFDLTGTQPLTGLTATFASGVNTYYTFNVTGNLKFDYINSDSVSGTFTLYSTIADTVTGGNKYIRIEDGKFFYAKKNGGIDG